MMRSNKEIAEEAHRRAAVVRERKKHRRVLIKISALIAGCLSLAVYLVVLPGRYSGAGLSTQAVVVSLYGEKAGGYILAWVIGFALGGVVMYLYLRRKRN